MQTARTNFVRPLPIYVTDKKHRPAPQAIFKLSGELQKYGSDASLIPQVVDRFIDRR